ncbi:hypothetical protein M2M32_08400 [Weissella cibaria]|uniref:hypothetical protein n=1 Tax=Weissella cibaria TaxID=137591 RepID=UPI001CD2D1D4|nr:hypothetical protein [Weissella cibaria]MCA1356213.1 hypothetical protein [Weissella cibaria]MDQ2126273.1 hypothetical protein [Weissella cibaria]MDQ2158998.1 hypothetical protein [Weissella cibaria]
MAKVNKKQLKHLLQQQTQVTRTTKTTTPLAQTVQHKLLNLQELMGRSVAQKSVVHTKAAIVLQQLQETLMAAFPNEEQPLALTEYEVKPHLGRYMVTHADRGDIMMEYEDFATAVSMMVKGTRSYADLQALLQIDDAMQLEDYFELRPDDKVTPARRPAKPLKRRMTDMAVAQDPQPDTTVTDLQSEINRLNKANKTLKKEAQANMARAVTAENEADSLRQDLANVETSVSATTDDQAALQAQLKQQATELAAANNMLMTYKKRLDEFEIADGEQDNNRRENEQLRQQVRELAASQQALQADLAQAQQENDRLHGELAQTAVTPATLTNREMMDLLIANLSADTVTDYVRLDRLVDKYNTLTNDEKSLWQQVQGQFVKNAGYWDFVTLNDVTYSSLDDQIDYNGIDTATIAEHVIYSAKVRSDTNVVVILRSLRAIDESATKVKDEPAEPETHDTDDRLAGKRVMIVSWFGQSAGMAKRRIEEYGAAVDWIDTSKIGEGKVNDMLWNDKYDLKIVVMNGSHHHTVWEAYEVIRKDPELNVRVEANPGVSTMLNMALALAD